ncbi:hypothetical protein [Alteraurantiacibacter aestuarii]|uniref:hypothetical protein n=1 Tax=Alteraurantiacibacter aestuarii TaxID=650004 RepID=UPI0031DFADDD
MSEGAIRTESQGSARRSAALVPSHQLALQAVWFLIAALATRAWVFGDLSYAEDEMLFFYIGQRMQDGLLPYVDVWDRKPPSLFLLYAVLAGISRSVLIFQLAATLCAAATAFVIARIASAFAPPAGAVLAGTIYLAALLPFGGGGGQAAVFFNLAMALAVLLVVSVRPALRAGRVSWQVYAAMALAGLAISFKQTAIFEAAFLGVFVLWSLARADTPRAGLIARGATFALIGAAPMLAWAGFFAASGHFAEFWHAMAGANLAKDYDPGGEWLVRLGQFGIILAPLLALAVIGMGMMVKDREPHMAFMAGWMAAALAGFLIIPNLIDHYALPLLVPITVIAAPVLGRGLIGMVAGLIATASFMWGTPVTDITRGMHSAQRMYALAQRIEAADPRPRVLVFDGPVYLYPLLGSHPPSPLIFPLHINYLPERDVSHLVTAQEVSRMIGARATTIVMRDRGEVALYNPDTVAALSAYVSQNCRSQFDHELTDRHGPYSVTVHTNCAH